MCVRVRAKKKIFCYVRMCVLAQRSTITALLKLVVFFLNFNPFFSRISRLTSENEGGITNYVTTKNFRLLKIQTFLSAHESVIVPKVF